jgi:hypothetical protein
MLAVAACGYFTISSSDEGIRAAAFVFSVLCWQFHYVAMMYEADSIRNSGLGKKRPEAEASPARSALPSHSPEASV